MAIQVFHCPVDLGVEAVDLGKHRSLLSLHVGQAALHLVLPAVLHTPKGGESLH